MSKRILYLGLDPTHYKCQTSDEVFHWPIIQIIPRPLADPAIQQTLLDFSSYSHMIITSKSTVHILQDYLPRLGFTTQSWSSKLTIAIGRVTAKYLKEWGINPIIAQEETAEGIIQELQKLTLANAHIFWPHSSQARSVIHDFLSKNCIRHTTCSLYDPQPRLPGHLPALETFDEILFSSPSTVKAFFSIFEKLPSHVRLTPIGPVTATFLENTKV
jgi:uroporphyrinogen-III synthase